MDVCLRKYLNRLYISGVGMFVFAFWTIVSFISYFVLDLYNLDDIVLEVGETEDALVPVAKAIAIGVVVIIIGLITLLKVYIGKSAMAAGKGNSRSILYLLLAFILFVVTLMEVILVLSQMGDLMDPSTDTRLLEGLSSIVTNVVEIFIEGEMIFSAFRVSRLRKKLKAVNNTREDGNS